LLTLFIVLKTKAISRTGGNEEMESELQRHRN